MIYLNNSKIGYTLPAYLLFLMNILGFGLLCMANNFKKEILFIGLGLLGLLILTYTVLVLLRMGDKFLFLIASMLVTIGAIMLCRININLGAKQIIWVSIGAIAFFGAYIVYYKIIKILISVSNPKNNGENSECFKALEYIKENYQRPITVSELSANANMSEASFYRLFKKQVGNSPIKYLNNYRLSLAADMLVNTELSVQAISEDVGIPDPVYFNKLFKRNYQMPPSKYRKVYSGR